MTLLIGWGVVVASIITGFMIAGGNPLALFVFSEWLVVGGCGVGYVIACGPPHVLKETFSRIVRSMKGSPYSKQAYLDVLRMLYELFLIGRQQGIIGLESHVMEPHNSSIIQKVPFFLHNHEAMDFFADSMKPVIDGKLKADALRTFMDQQFNQKDMNAYHTVHVLGKVADALPGLGIVAAVLGIVITMANIDGPVKEVGHHVASALVGTFLGIFLSYGLLQPLASNIEFVNNDEVAYFAVIRAGIVSFTAGAAPLTAAENMRVCIPEDRRIGSAELETLLKSQKSG